MFLFLRNISNFVDEFGESCQKYVTKYLDEDDKIYVEYNGKNVDRSCNAFQFKGESDDYLDEYKVCLTPVYFTDPDCAVSVNIKSSYYSGTEHVSDVYYWMRAIVFFIVF